MSFSDPWIRRDIHDKLMWAKHTLIMAEDHFLDSMDEVLDGEDHDYHPLKSTTHQMIIINKKNGYSGSPNIKGFLNDLTG